MEIGWFGVAGHRPLDYRGWAASYVWCWGVMQNAVITPAIETFTRLRSGLWKKTRLCLCGAGGREHGNSLGECAVSSHRLRKEGSRKRQKNRWKTTGILEGPICWGRTRGERDGAKCNRLKRLSVPSFLCRQPSLPHNSSGGSRPLPLSLLSLSLRF